MQNSPFEDQQPLTPTIPPPNVADDGKSSYSHVSSARTMGRWLVLGVHGVVFFGVLIFITPTFPSNDFRLLLMGWGGLLVVHTLLTCLLDVREGYLHGRRVRRAIHQAEVMEKRARMLEKLNKPE